LSKITLFPLAALVAIVAHPASAQQSGPREWAFGFSGVSYLIEPTDGAFTDPDRHRTKNFGFRLSKASFGDRRWGWLIDTEVYLGVANRMLIDVDLPNTIFGLQGFVGPVVAVGPLQLYAAGGVNRTTIGKSEIITVPGLVVITYVGTGGLSNLWAAQLNALGQSAGSGGNVEASIPRYSDVSPAGMLGFAWDVGSMFRFSFDYIPIFMEPKRDNFRFTFSLAG
jgi:hypothetical protein